MGVLTLNNLSKSFDEKVILNDVNYTFEKGKIYGLLGKNGAGKTTLFNIISKNLRLDDGSILLNHDEHYDELDIGYLQSQVHLPAFMTGVEFVKYFLDIHEDRVAQRKNPEVYLAQVGIEEADMHKLLRDYSLGMKNKVQMLTALIVAPPVILLDEPMSSFDVVAAHEMKEMLRTLKSDAILILATHIMPLAKDLCDDIVLLHNGHLKEIAPEDWQNPDFEAQLIQMMKEPGGDV